MDNGMGMEEQAAGQGRSSEGSDVAQGLQWGPGAGTAPASPTKKKSSSGRKAAKEEQVCHPNCTCTTEHFFKVTLLHHVACMAAGTDREHCRDGLIMIGGKATALIVSFECTSDHELAAQM